MVYLSGSCFTHFAPVGVKYEPASASEQGFSPSARVLLTSLAFRCQNIHGKTEISRISAGATTRAIRQIVLLHCHNYGTKKNLLLSFGDFTGSEHETCKIPDKS